MSSRFLVVAGAVLLAACATALVTSAPTAAAKDDPAAKQKARDELRKELKDKKFFVYFDLSYYVDAPKLKESRWDWKDPPTFDGLDEKKGVEFQANWVPAAGAEAGIEFLVQKFPHYNMVGDKRQPNQMSFKSAGSTALVSKIDEMAKGLYEDWVAESTEPIKDHCKEPKKVKTGVAEWYATAVATDKQSKKRVRKDWYVWGTTGAGIPCCWFATVTISDKFKDTEEVLQMAKNMMLQTIEIKDKRADN